MECSRDIGTVNYMYKQAEKHFFFSSPLSLAPTSAPLWSIYAAMVTPPPQLTQRRKTAYFVDKPDKTAYRKKKMDLPLGRIMAGWRRVEALAVPTHGTRLPLIV